jgi:hypothetical protein
MNDDLSEVDTGMSKPHFPALFALLFRGTQMEGESRKVSERFSPQPTSSSTLLSWLARIVCNRIVVLYYWPSGRLKNQMRDQRTDEKVLPFSARNERVRLTF